MLGERQDYRALVQSKYIATHRFRELGKACAKHSLNILIERYGMDEVRQWKFEVWNEPNIIFWSGTKEQYFEPYRTSSLALKSVSSELKVGGPSTAEASWVP